MDNYPEHLAPEFEEGGAVSTPFEDWWPTVRHAFPYVPENVARYWLHEHWRHSPYCWLPSASYRFRLAQWRASELTLIRSGRCDFAPDNHNCRERGEYLVATMPSAEKYATALYMKEHRDFPAPIIVLDNRDGHLRIGVPPTPAWCNIPKAFVLVEGHRRFDMALYLASIGEFTPQTTIWLMERASDRSA